MPEFTKDDFYRAREIAEKLRQDWRRGDRDPRPFEGDLEDGISIADVQVHADQFYDELETLAYLDIEYPGVHIDSGNPVPVSVTEALPKFFSDAFFLRRDLLRYVGFPDRERLSQELQRGMRRFGEGVRWLSPTEADDSFIARVTDFLACRLFGKRVLADDEPLRGCPPTATFTMQKFVGGPLTQVNGCHFSVHTKSSQLDAYWSGAYLVTPNYHGRPTSPAIGPLQAGTYIFGVNGGAYGSQVKWDHNKVCTLPGVPSVFLSY